MPEEITLFVTEVRRTVVSQNPAGKGGEASVVVLGDCKRKRVGMKRWTFVAWIVVFLLAIFPDGWSWVSDRTYGQLRAPGRRAATITQQKNDFVARVLYSRKIADQRKEKGVVVCLQLGNEWRDVDRIEIVPLVQEGDRGLNVVSTRSFFTHKAKSFTWSLPGPFDSGGIQIPLLEERVT